MTDKEIIAKQAEKIIRLEDKLAKFKNRSINIYRPSSREEHNLLADLIKMGVKF